MRLNNLNISIDSRCDNFERIDYVMKKFGIKKSTVFSYVKKGIVPPGIKVSHKMTVWTKSVIDESFKQFCREQGINVL